MKKIPKPAQSFVDLWDHRKVKSPVRPVNYCQRHHKDAEENTKLRKYLLESYPRRADDGLCFLYALHARVPPFSER